METELILARWQFGVTTVLIFAFVAATYAMTDAFARLGLNPGIVPISAAGALLAAAWLIHRERMGWAFMMTTCTIELSTVTIFMSLYPRVLVSSLSPEWSLTIYNASSSPKTLKVMSVVALLFVPVVLAYQSWTYWVFRQRVGRETPLEY